MLSPKLFVVFNNISSFVPETVASLYRIGMENSSIAALRSAAGIGENFFMEPALQTDLARQVISYWADFVKYKDPNKKDYNGNPLVWTVK